MIVHVDMDAFFASVEQLDDPSLRGRPVIVAGGARSVVSTCSYEARRFGVHSAMPTATARALCPSGVFVPPRFHRYEELSKRVMAALGEFSSAVEPASIDEAYLDASGCDRLWSSIDALVGRLRLRVREVTGGLTCSVGAAPVKFLAKICSDRNKPDGVCILRPDQVDSFLLQLSVSSIPGVGRQMRAALEGFGIRSVADMRRFSRQFFEDHFGKVGILLFERAMGRDLRRVEPVRESLSEGSESTFSVDTYDRDVLRRRLLEHAERVGAHLREHATAGRTVTLKIKYADFSQITRSKTLGQAICSTQGIYEAALDLLKAVHLKGAVRLIGVSVSNFGLVPEPRSLLSLAEGGSSCRADVERRNLRLDHALDALRERFGAGVIQRGVSPKEKR